MNDAIVDLNTLFNESTHDESAETLKERLYWQKQIVQTIINNLPSSIFVKDLNGRRILVNKTNYTGAGFKSESQVLGKSDFEIFPQKIAEKFWADDSKVLKNGEVIKDREEHIVNAEGTERWQSTSKIPITDSNNNVVGLVGFGHDITAEKKLAQENLLVASKIDEQQQAVENMIIDLTSIPDKIGHLVNGIANISKQTKMVAINAAIEAARVGEHGKGFEIVAQEIGSLSDQSSKATEEVRKAIEEIDGMVQKIMQLWEEVKVAK